MSRLVGAESRTPATRENVALDLQISAPWLRPHRMHDSGFHGLTSATPVVGPHIKSVVTVEIRPCIEMT